MKHELDPETGLPSWIREFLSGYKWQWVPGENPNCAASWLEVKIPMKNHHAQKLGSLGGKAKSAAKSKAAKANGAKGGRPRKLQAPPASGTAS